MEQTGKKRLDFSSYAKAVGFLLLEVLAFISFGLGHSFVFYAILSLVMVALIVLVSFRQIKTDGLMNLAIFLFPLLIYGVLSALSFFALEETSFIFYKSPLLIFVPLGLASFAACGYLAANIESFDLKKALLVIYGALAIYVLINFIATMVQFGPLYTVRYKGYSLYYNGKPSPTIDTMAYGLIGFQFAEVSIEYYSLFPSVLLSSVLAIPFVKIKEEKKTFIAYCAFAVLSLLAIFLAITRITAISTVLVILALIVIFILKAVKLNKKVVKYVFITLGALAGIGFVMFALNSQYLYGMDIQADGIKSFISKFRNFIAGNSLFNRLFNTNALSQRYIGLLDGSFYTSKAFGWVFQEAGWYPELGIEIKYAIESSNSWLFDNILTSGIFGAIFFIVLLVIGYKAIVKFMANEEELDYTKILVAGFVTAFFMYSLINFDMTPFIFHSDIHPIYLSGLFMICVFLFLYCYGCNSLKKAEAKKEEPKEEDNIIEEVTIDE